jgi:hypothetical protein
LQPFKVPTDAADFADFADRQSAAEFRRLCAIRGWSFSRRFLGWHVRPLIFSESDAPSARAFKKFAVASFFSRAAADGFVALALFASALDCNALYPRVVIRAETHDVGIVFKSIVNDPAVVGIHGFQFHRATRDSNRIRQLAHPLPKLVIAHGTPVSDIYLNSGRVSVLRMKDSVQ